MLHGCRFIFSPRPAHCRSEISRTASLSLSLLHISSLRKLPSSATGSGRLLSKFAALPAVLHKHIKFLNFVRVLHGCRFIISPRPAHCRSEISRSVRIRFHYFIFLSQAMLTQYAFLTLILYTKACEKSSTSPLFTAGIRKDFLSEVLSYNAYSAASRYLFSPSHLKKPVSTRSCKLSLVIT